MGVAACLQKDPLPTATVEALTEPMQPEIMPEPVVATMCTSCIIQDETTGVTYMDTVTTFMGRVALQELLPGGLPSQTHHRGCHQPPLRRKRG